MLTIILVIYQILAGGHETRLELHPTESMEACIAMGNERTAQIWNDLPGIGLRFECADKNHPMFRPGGHHTSGGH